MADYLMRRAARLALWVLRLTWAALVGGLVRTGRRCLRLSPRVWRGPSPMAWDAYLVAADQLAGFPTRLLQRDSAAARQAVAREPRAHAIVNPPGTAWQDVHLLALADLLRHGDVFVAYFDSHFFRPDQRRLNELSLRLLRLLGVRVLVAAYGGDVVHRSRTATRFDWIDREQRDYPDWDLVAQAAIARARIRLFCRHARLVLPGDSVMRRFLPRDDVFFRYFPIDTEALQPRSSPSRHRPVIVHAPNHRLVKGTDLLLSALERLAARGIDAELRLVEKVPRAQALALYSEADIIADQFCMGSFGLFAVEGLALGKPVLTYLDQETLGEPVFSHPLVNAHAENLEAVLAVLLQVGELRERLGRAGRESVERYQSIPALAEVWHRLYRHVWWGEALRLEDTRHFGSERLPRSFCEDPADAAFWPVATADLSDAIRAALERVGLLQAKARSA